MSATVPPIIPPRPVRQDQAAAAGASRLPEIPPRPINKRLERSVSPSNYPRSPLYDPPAYAGSGRRGSNDKSHLNVPPRPPSVTLPSIGQEGNEYADLEYQNSESTSALATDAAAQTRNIGGDLKLHAPKPSLPTVTAKNQVEAVTGTTSKQAAALGIGKPSSPALDENEPISSSVRSRSSFSRPASQASTERRTSIAYGDDQGLADFGLRVPINPQLGEVQAPSPAPFGSERSASIGGHLGEYGAKKHHHKRTKSGREVFLPPGSYGLHGHGAHPQDKFEKDWYAKHPEQLLHDEDRGLYASTGSGRGEFALSSDDLNQLVRNTASRGAGFGTSGSNLTYPDEQIGYLASEQLVSRSSVTSPNPLYKMQSNSSQPAVESPLRKTSFPAEEVERDEFKRSRGSLSGRSDEVVDSEHDDDVIHIASPKRRYNKVSGGQESIQETADVQPYITHPSEEGGLVDEHGYSVPILASDEVAREVGGDSLQPAVPPRQERRGSGYDFDMRDSGDVTPSSRPSSRPSSIHGGLHGMTSSLSRFSSRHEDHREDMHTPLEDVDEYEPLFPDEDHKKKAMNAADRFKRPQAIKHRFPSQDIWEDTPSSAMHVATVSSPDIQDQAEQPSKGSSSTFEHPDVEAARKGEATEAEKKKLIPREEKLAKSKFAPHLRDDMPTRPGVQPRFPSQDIWEDTPESQYLVTTITPRPDEESSETAPSKPTIPPRPAKSRLGEGASSSQAQPSVPPRPQKQTDDSSVTSDQKIAKEVSPTEARKVPSIPERPKPQVPVRPAKKTSSEALSKTISSTSAGSSGSADTEKGVSIISPPPVKAKPQVPTRPGQGSKIASLKSNFMNDLNQKLQLGPPKEKEKEPEVEQEAKPLEDARKGRARGPQRRAPAKSPSGAAESTAAPPAKTVRFSLASPATIWHIDSADGALRLHSREQTSAAKSEGLPEPSDSAKEIGTSEVSDAPDAPVTISESKLEQMEHSTPSGAATDTVAEGTTDEGTMESKMAQTSAAQAADVPETMAPSLATNTAGEPADPTPTIVQPEESSNPVERTKQQDFGGASLSQQTTASSGSASGQSLARVESREQGPALSQQTTASSKASGPPLEREQTREDEQPAKFRTEQVQAPVPAAGSAPGSEDLTSGSASDRKVTGGAVGESKAAELEKAAGADSAKEPSNENDVDYKKLEEMTARADGKGHSAIEPTEAGRQAGARETSTA